MIAVDSSVWIDHLNDRPTQQVLTLRATILDRRDVVTVGDVVLCEALQGLASDREANLVEAAMRRFELVSMTSPRLAVIAAGHYRTLRRLGITVRKTIDLLIGTFCIDKDMPLLHADRDFEPMAQHLGLRVIATG